jgi:hypothetical protein
MPKTLDSPTSVAQRVPVDNTDAIDLFKGLMKEDTTDIDQYQSLLNQLNPGNDISSTEINNIDRISRALTRFSANYKLALERELDRGEGNFKFKDNKDTRYSQTAIARSYERFSNVSGMALTLQNKLKFYQQSLNRVAVPTGNVSKEKFAAAAPTLRFKGDETTFISRADEEDESVELVLTPNQAKEVVNEVNGKRPPVAPKNAIQHLAFNNEENLSNDNINEVPSFLSNSELLNGLMNGSPAAEVAWSAMTQPWYQAPWNEDKLNSIYISTKNRLTKLRESLKNYHLKLRQSQGTEVVKARITQTVILMRRLNAFDDRLVKFVQQVRSKRRRQSAQNTIHPTNEKTQQPSRRAKLRNWFKNVTGW